MQSNILITGAARSGTSMVAGIINICGAFAGITSGANRHNKKGMFENSVIRTQIMKPYLRNLGFDAKGQYPLPNPFNLPIPDDLNNRVLQVLRQQGYKKGTWMYKGAKMCLTWTIWHDAFPDAKWVIIRRKNEDIIDSCLRTGFMTAFRHKNNQQQVGVNNERDGWAWWVNQHEERFREMILAGLQIKMIYPATMVFDKDYTKMKEIIDWLDLTWDKRAVEAFIEPKLYHTTNKEGK